MLNDEYKFKLLVIGQSIYATFNSDEEQIVIEYELLKNKEYYIYFMYKFGYYDVETDAINLKQFLRDIYILITVLIAGKWVKLI